MDIFWTGHGENGRGMAKAPAGWAGAFDAVRVGQTFTPWLRR